MKKTSKKSTARPKVPKAPRPPRSGFGQQWAQGSAQGGAGKVVLAALAIGTAGVVGYFGWQYYKKKQQSNSNLDNELRKVQPESAKPDVQPPSYADTTRRKSDTYVPPADAGTGKKSGSSASRDGFPLKKGSKGDNVRALQQALITKYGSSVLPKYGADGDFGSETQNALKKNGLPTVVSESTFNVITQGGSGSGGGGSDTSLSALGDKLYNAASSKNLNTVLSLLKSIKSTDDYQKVSAAFAKHRLHGVHQTLVNGLLGSFASEDQKQKIRMEFIRIGLQYDGSKWSLSGFDSKPIVTKEPATVWVNATQSVPVPAMMVLGNEVAQRLDYTLFENNNKYFLVKTQSVKYL